MMSQKFLTHKFANGLSLIAEPMENVSSVAYSLLIPAGAAYDPQDRQGASNLLVDLSSKGAGGLDNRGLSEAYDNLGINRSQSSGVEVSVYSGALLSENLTDAIELLAKIVGKPALPAEELESVKSLALQELRALEDEPASKVMVELAKEFYPSPFGRSQLGTKEHIESITTEDLKSYHSDRFAPGEMILAIAGKFDFEEVKNTVEESFSHMSGSQSLLEKPTLSTESRAIHKEKDTAQMQIALAYPSVPYSHPDYYIARVGVGVLSGGMAGRLFIEVREKRGLVYRVSASHSGVEGRAAVFAYAGTTPENAKECLDVMCEQLRSLKNGVDDDELKRSKADLKARLVMQGEISSVRASALASDYWNLARPRTLEEIEQAIEKVTAADIVRHAEEHPLDSVCLVTMGSVALEIPK